MNIINWIKSKMKPRTAGAMIKFPDGRWAFMTPHVIENMEEYTRELTPKISRRLIIALGKYNPDFTISTKPTNPWTPFQRRMIVEGIRAWDRGEWVKP